MVDPFAGSCVTGVVAENLRRRWVCCELSEEYLLGAKARFVPTVQPLPKERAVAYEIGAPCARPVDEEDVPLFADGGADRPPELKRKTAAMSPEAPIRSKQLAEWLSEIGLTPKPTMSDENTPHSILDALGFAPPFPMGGTDWSTVPDTPGVYALFDQEDVVYVGMAGRDQKGSLRRRLRDHASGQIVNMFAQYLLFARLLLDEGRPNAP